VPLSAVQVLGNIGPDDLVDFEVSRINQFQFDQSFESVVMCNYLEHAFLLKDQDERMGNQLPNKYYWDVAVKTKNMGMLSFREDSIRTLL
jgi:hypothetical protein